MIFFAQGCRHLGFFAHGNFPLILADPNSISFRDNDYLDEVLEKQADMIRYLQQHNANLGKRLMKLTAQQSRSSLDTV